MIRIILLTAALCFIQTYAVEHSVESHEHDGHDCEIYKIFEQIECSVAPNTIGLERTEYRSSAVPLDNYIPILEGYNFPDIRAPPYHS